MTDDLKTAREISEILGVSYDAVRKWPLKKRGTKLVEWNFKGLNRQVPATLYSLDDASMHLALIRARQWERERAR